VPSGCLLSSGRNLPAHGRLATWTALFVVVATPVAIAYHYVARAYFHQGYPWDTFLVNSRFHFNDYYLVYLDAKHFHPGGATNIVYSPLLHLLMTALTAVPAAAGFAVMCATFVAVLVAVLWSWVTAADMDTGARLQQVAILSLLSYPVLFLLDRGNLEMVVFAVLAAFFWLYYARRSRWAWVPLALAIASKYYWVTLLLLPLSDRSVRQAVFALAGAIFATVASGMTLAFTSGYSVAAVFHNTLSTLSARGTGYGAYLTIQHAHTFWSALQLLNRLTDYSLSPLPHLDAGYFAIAGLVFALVAYNVLARDLAPWRKVTVLIAATLVLPFESFDYTLIHLYFPLAMLVCATYPARGIRLALALVAVCLVPMAYYYFTIWGVRYDSGVSVLVYPVALAGLIVVPLLTGEKERLTWRSLLTWTRLAASDERPASGVSPALADGER